jgi:hypothetical protein
MFISLVQRVEGSRIPEQTSHALFQLTGALRNVAGEEEMFPQFVSTGAVNELCRAMELFSPDLDIISNISRTLRYSCYTLIIDRRKLISDACISPILLQHIVQQYAYMHVNKISFMLISNFSELLLNFIFQASAAMTGQLGISDRMCEILCFI